jgi:hypothetical protein
MWDKPEYLKRIADALFVLALLGVLYAVLIYALHQPIFNHRTKFESFNGESNGVR